MSETEISSNLVSSRVSALEFLREKIVLGVQPNQEDISAAFSDQEDLSVHMLEIVVAEAFEWSCNAAMSLFDGLPKGWRATHMWGPGDDDTWRVNLTRHADKPMYASGQSDLFSRAMLIAVLNAHIEELKAE